MVSNGHPKHGQLRVGRSTPKKIKSTLWIAISLVACRYFCYMTTKLVAVDLGLAKTVGVGLKMKFSIKRNFLIYHPTI
jgi:hypothetical protein